MSAGPDLVLTIVGTPEKSERSRAAPGGAFRLPGSAGIRRQEGGQVSRERPVAPWPCREGKNSVAGNVVSSLSDAG